MNPQSLLLYAITDCDHMTGKALYEHTERLLQGGITMLQFRDKTRSRDEALPDAQALAALCHRYGVPFLVNDDIELARISGADGVHLGQEDGDCRMAKLKLGRDKIVGISAHNLEEAAKAAADGADYLGCGAIFPSVSKEADTLPLETLRAICEASPLPVVAIGGITADNAHVLQGTGIMGLSVISALYRAKDGIAAARHLLDVAAEVTGQERPSSVGRALLMDSDVILFDSYEVWRHLASDYLERHGHLPGPDLFSIIQDKTMPEQAAYVKHNYSTSDGIVPMLKAWDAALEKAYEDEVRPVPGAERLLKISQDYEIAWIIATEAPKDLASALLARHGMDAPVRGILSGTEDRFSRTSATFYHKAHDLAGSPLAQTFVIEDRLGPLKTAKEAGFTVLGLRTARSGDDWAEIELHADRAFQDLDHLAEWLDRHFFNA